MESLRIGEIVAVSRYLTPNHLDVTNVPLTYAPPKAPWIDGYVKRRAGSPIDAQDRLARRRMQTRAIVNPEDIPVLPALVAAPLVPREHVVVRELRYGFKGATAVFKVLARRLKHEGTARYDDAPAT